MHSRLSHYLSDDRDLKRTGSSPDRDYSRRLVVDEPSSLLALGQSMSLGDGAIFGRDKKQNQDSTSMGVLNEVTKKGMSCLEPDTTMDTSYETTASRQAIPRRNLTEAFEELYVEQPPSDEAKTPAPKEPALTESTKKGSTEESPTAVADLVVVTDEPSSRETSTSALQETEDALSQALSFEEEEGGDDSTTTYDEIPHFELHASLQRDLSQALVNRVSFYGVIHDINKEANSMSTNDTSSFARSCEEIDDEEFSPIVVAVNGAPSRPMPHASSLMEAAAIDEEKWLLEAIESRGDDESRSVAACPPTFLQAMGEREYERPLSSMESSRTQLWKPSRSWWEAKSGKNPWIEPESHNKRWRYLWPLIHYHKFLAKCIKKLKRNGVDVKTSVSPVAVFLREEVCAVSDHLASVSLFTSEEWMGCLVHFNGWTDHSPKAEKRLRMLVSTLKLRPLAEPGDVDSPLLRSQVDEHFLRAMASAREQMTHGGIQQERANLSKNASQQSITDKPIRKSDQVRNKIPLHPQRSHPSSAPVPHSMPNHMATPAGSAHGNADGQQYGYRGHGGGHWWANGWPQYAYCDESSVQSGLSGDSYFQQYPDYGMYPGANGPYYPPPPDRSEYYYGQQAGGYPPYQADHHGMGWMGHPHGGTGGSNHGAPPGTPSHSSPHRNYNFYHEYSPSHGVPGNETDFSRVETPHKTPYKNGVPSSPYWAHLDQATLAMTGLVTPRGKHPDTPQRERDPLETNPGTDKDAEKETTPEQVDRRKPPDTFVANAKPLLINNHSQYYPRGSYGAREGYAPPSPATQFMMSPQANSQAAAYYAHTYGSGAYGFSPRRHGWRQHPKPAVTPQTGRSPAAGNDGEDSQKTSPTSKSTEVTPPPSVRKVTDKDRHSPATVETVAESESIVVVETA